MSAHWWALRIIQSFEARSAALNPSSSAANSFQDRIVATILRQPGFHRAVGRIHRTIHEKQYGRNPHEPLAPGEATADPGAPDRSKAFIRHFFDELKNQAKGKPTDLPHEPPKK